MQESSIEHGGTSAIYIFMATLALFHLIEAPTMRLPNIKMLLHWLSRMHIYGFVENRTFWSNLIGWGYQCIFQYDGAI